MINFIKKNYERIKVIKLNKNYGYAKGYNIGLKNINAEIICLLNNDVEVSKNWTEPIIQQFKKEKNTAVIQPKLKNQEDKRYFDYAGYLRNFGTFEEININFEKFLLKDSILYSSIIFAFTPIPFLNHISALAFANKLYYISLFAFLKKNQK